MPGPFDQGTLTAIEQHRNAPLPDATETVTESITYQGQVFTGTVRWKYPSPPIETPLADARRALEAINGNGYTLPR